MGTAVRTVPRRNARFYGELLERGQPVSITVFPAADVSGSRGVTRTAHWIMLPRTAGAGGNGYYNARAAVDVAAVIPSFATGAAGAYSFQADALYGGYRRHQGVTNAAPAYVTIAPVGLSLLPARMDQVSAFAPPFGQVLIFRELIQSFASGPLPANHQMLHGFSLQHNLIAGFPQFTAGTWRGIAIAERQGDVVLAVKNANPATLITLPGVSLSAVRQLIEHRLYMPTATRTGRYELLINEALVAVVDGTHPNFPHPLAITDSWAFMPFSLNNPGTATTAGFRAWWGEIITGPDLESTY